jgi:hypothetical protein
MTEITSKEIETTIEEAFIYAFPMLMGYRFAFGAFLMPGIPSYRGPGIWRRWLPDDHDPA